MPRIEEVIGSYTPLTRAGEQWVGPCPFEQHEGQLEVIGERWRCVCGAHQDHDDATGFMLLAVPLLGEREIKPTLLRPTPPPSKWAISRAAERDGTILIVDTRKAAEVAAKLLPRYSVAAWPDGGSRWDGLEPLRGRNLLLWPSPEGAQAMQRLEAVVADPAGLACQGKIVEAMDLGAWTGTSEELIAWAKANVRPLAPKNPAGVVAGGVLANPPAGNGREQSTPSEAPPPPAGPLLQSGLVSNNPGSFNNSQQIELGGVLPGMVELGRGASISSRNLDSDHRVGTKSNNVESAARADGSENHIPALEKVGTDQQLMHSANTVGGQGGAMGIKEQVSGLSTSFSASSVAELHGTGSGGELGATENAGFGDAHRTGIIDDSEPPPAFDPDDTAAQPQRPPRKRHRHLAVVGNTALSEEPDQGPLPAELSEDALSNDFASQHGEDWRCVKSWGQWLHWDGEAWAEDRDDSRVEPMRAICRAALYTPEGQRLTPDGRRKLGRQAVAYAALRYAGTDQRIRSTPEVWDCDPYMLGVPGGVIDLKAGKLIESAREQHITMRCAVSPDSGTPATWLKMLRYWLGDDEDVLGFLRRYLGYALTGDGREQCMAFFYGPAAAGKGTIMRLISYIMGSIPPPGNSKFRSYHYEAPIATFLESRNERHSTELAAMHQKRLITSEEPAAGAKWDEAKIKWLTGGSFVTARYMRGDNFSFSMTGKIIVAANHRPRLATTDTSIKRRMHVIPFEHPVADEERDNDLDAKLRAEAPQILNWLIQACMEWQDCGLGLPEKVSLATETYLQAEDVLAQWIDEACDRDGDSASKSLYQSYCTWAEEQGEKVWSRRAWANALTEKGFTTRKGTAGMRMICGLTPKLAPPPA